MTQTLKSYWSLYVPSGKNFHILPTQGIYFLFMDVITNSYIFPIQGLIFVLYNREAICLLRGTY
jgi:hypothetical protein